MREVVDAHFSTLEKSDSLAGMDSFYQRAYAMMSSEKARDAFDLKKESDKLRDEYGRNAAGSVCCSRAGSSSPASRFVSLTYGSWDHHDNIRTESATRCPPSIRLLRPSYEISTNAACSHPHSSCSQPNLAARLK